jgi:DNA primase
LPGFPEDVIDSIRQAVDLVELVSRYVPLKRAGKSWKGCCPFHQEKTPSFNVHPEKGFWKCFGCGKGGNAFVFLMEKEGLTFPEAVRQLAKDTGIHLPGDDDPAAARHATRIARLRDVCEWACHEFERALRAPAGQPAREYFKRRGITGETAVRFRLGYAPPGWQNLSDAARAAGIAEQDLIELGLLRRKDAEDGRPARTFDFFRDRVTFPICDSQGRVIAFGARTLGDDEPKYLNSPETPLFSKGRNVYALHLAKQEMMRTGEGAVMEGYTDVIMAHQCGWPVAVAGLGTALTREQASLVARYVKRVYLVYDGDAAGLKAADRNSPAFLPEEVETRVVLITGGKDPCDVLLSGGLAALKSNVDASREVFDHLLDAAKRVPGEAQALDAALAPLVGVTSRTRRPLYVKRVADAFRISDAQVLDRLKEIEKTTAPAERAAPPHAHASAVSEPPPPVRASRNTSPPSPTEQHLIEALLGRPDLCAEAAERLAVDTVVHPLCRDLLERLLGRYEATGTAPPVDAILGGIDDPELSSFAEGLRARGAGKDLLGQGRDCIQRLTTQHEARRLREGLDQVAGPAAERRELNSDEGEMLRRWVEFHRRRSAGA